jgi:3-deoxy-D-manno-octulosonic-acid transferase
MSPSPSTTPPPADWRKLAYDILLIVLSPLGLLYMLWRLVVKGKSSEGMAERFGVLPEGLAQLGRGSDPVIWVHAVSAGEVAAVEPILHELRLAEPTARLVLSTTTPTGRALARRKNLELDGLFYFPLDFPGISERVLNALRPALIVVAETELWPHLLATARARGVRTCIVNGRISGRAFPRYRLCRPLIAWTLSQLDLLCVQSDLDRERFLALGADPARVAVLGNSKFDENFPQVPPEETAKWRQDLGFSQDQPIFLAASTHPHEEEMVLHCFHELRARLPELGLLLAPRHPERGDAVEALITSFGYACCRRSRGPVGESSSPGGTGVSPVRSDARAQVALLDTIGELTRVFSVATVVFMGGSLVPVGGHNFLQPMAQRKPVVFGPYMQNSRDLTELALREGAALQVRNGDELTETVRRLLHSETDRNLLAVKAESLLSRNAGASRAMVERILPLLEGA